MATLATSAVIASAPAHAAVDGDFAISVEYDGTGHGTADACPVADAPIDGSANDGVVCTNDTIGYAWDYSLSVGSEARTIGFSQTIPAGLLFDPSNIALLESGTGYTGTATIVVNGDGTSTLTAELTFAPNQSLSGSLPILVDVTGNTPNGTVVQPSLTLSEGEEEPETHTATEVVVRSAPQVDLRKRHDTLGILEVGGELGYVIRVFYFGYQTGTNGKGAATLENVITFSDDISGMTPNTVLMSQAYAGFGFCSMQTGANLPDVGIGVTRGTPTCAQAAPGSAVEITVTGADTSGYAPDGYQYGQLPGYTTVLGGGFNLFVPFGDIPPGDEGINVSNQLLDFDPDDIAGQSNFGAGYEPGGAPTDDCEGTAPGNPSPDNNNCVTTFLFILEGQTEPIYGLKLLRGIDDCPSGYPFGCRFLPGETSGALQQGQAGPGKPFNSTILVNAPLEGGTVEGLVLCDVFDPTQQQFDTTRDVLVNRVANAGVFADPSTYDVQFAALDPFVGCGLPGDDTTEGPWFDDIDDAGGPGVVNVVRVVDTSAGITRPERFWLSIPFVNVETTIGAQVDDQFWGRWDGKTSEGSEDSDSSLLRINGYNVVNSLVGVDKTVVPAATTVAAGQTVTYELAPSLTSTGPAVTDSQVVTLTDTLPPCLVNPQPTTETLENWSVTVTQADVGPDGIACTADDVGGAVLTFVSLEELDTESTLPSASYTVQVAPNVSDLDTATNTVVASTPAALESGQVQSTREDALTLTVRAASQIMVSKVVDLPVIEVEPDRTGWTVTLANQSNSNAGVTQFIDVFPWNGDARGSDFSGTLELLEVELFGDAATGTTLEYTSRNSSLVNDDPTAASNADGGATVWCEVSDFGTAGCPDGIGDATALRFTSESFPVGWLGAFHMEFQPAGNEEGDLYVNRTGPGDATGLALPVPRSSLSQTRVVASTIGDIVWWDHDEDGIQGPDEPGIPNVVVELRNSDGAVIATTTTDALGFYSFGNLHSGTYRVTIDVTSLPEGAIATYDLDGGVVFPDSDSGYFEVGIDVDRTDVDFGYRGAPSVYTQISTMEAIPGTEVHDVVTIAGTGGAPGVLTWTLFGPAAPVMTDGEATCVGANWNGVVVVASGELEFVGDAVVITPDLLLPDEGCFSYVASASVEGFDEDASHAIGIPNETVLVRAEPVTPPVEPGPEEGPEEGSDDETDEVTDDPTQPRDEGDLALTGVAPILTVAGILAAMFVLVGYVFILWRRRIVE